MHRDQNLERGKYHVRPQLKCKSFPKVYFILVYFLTLHPQVFIYQFICAMLTRSLKAQNVLSSAWIMGYLDTAHQLPWSFYFLSSKWRLEILFLNIRNVVGSPGGKWVSQSPFSWWFRFTMAVNVINAPVSREWNCQLRRVQMWL